MAIASLTLGACRLALAQTPASTTTQDVVELPQFTITETQANRYQPQSALSASRVAMPILDIPQTISVVPRELMDDSMGMRMLDAAKYVTPIVENTLPFGGDRYTIRGFTVSAEFIDGTNISGPDGYSMSQAPYNIERLEIIKGPNAILVPGGSPGGVMNPITKAPMMTKNEDTVTLEASRYYSNAVSIDSNRMLTKDGKMAARLVAAFWNYDYYIRNQTRRGYEISPSFSYQFTTTEKLTIKADFVQNRETNLGGLPIDPNIGGTSFAKIAAGLPDNWSFGNETDNRHRRTERASAELLSTLGTHVNSRLYFMADHVHRRDVGGTAAGLSNAGGGSQNPYTGLYEPGISWNTAAWQSDTTGTVVLAGTSAPVTAQSAWIYKRNNGLTDLDYLEAHIKNDYAIKFDTDLFNSTTIAGFAANSSKVHWKSWASAPRPDVPANNLYSITYPGYVFPPLLPGLTTAGLGTDRTGQQDDLQAFAYETVSVLKDHLLLSGGVSRFFGNLSRIDNTGTAILAALPNSPAYGLTTNATSFGITVKPIKEVALFYDRNTTGGAMPGSLNAGVTSPTLKVAVGSQKEFGIKTSLLDNKFTASISHFDIVQSNFQVTNSEFYRLQSLGLTDQANALPQFYLLNLESKGWEGEFTYSFSKNLTVLGNITSLKIRQPITNLRVRGVPDRNYGLYADYRFTEGVLNGFGVNFGMDFKSDVAGENSSNYTTTKALPSGPAFVPSQASFLVAGRTLVNVGFTYKYQNVTVGLTILNAMDKSYIMGAGSRGSLVVGTPRDWKMSVSYKF